MRKSVFLFLLICSVNSFAQEVPNDYAKHFLGELKSWTSTFIHFDVSEFELEETISFTNLVTEQKNISNIPELCKSIASYSPDNKSAVDIYAYLNLKRIRGFFTSTITKNQQADLYLNNENKKITLLSVSKTSSIDEAFWQSNTKLFVVGITNVAGNKKPFILIVDTVSQTVLKFKSSNSNCKQKTAYLSPNLRQMEILYKK